MQPAFIMSADSPSHPTKQGSRGSPGGVTRYVPPGTGGLPYEMHRLGGRNEDGLAHVVVMKTFRGWHCPHCSYISPSQKGNLKVHILNRHANPGESFVCMFCGKHLSSRSSLQVHVSQVHREQNKAKRMLEERMKISNLEERLKSEMVAGMVAAGGGTLQALHHNSGMPPLLPNQTTIHGQTTVVPTSLAGGPRSPSSGGSQPQSPGRGQDTPPPLPPAGYSPGHKQADYSPPNAKSVGPHGGGGGYSPGHSHPGPYSPGGHQGGPPSPPDQRHYNPHLGQQGYATIHPAPGYPGQPSQSGGGGYSPGAAADTHVVYPESPAAERAPPTESVTLTPVEGPPNQD